MKFFSYLVLATAPFTASADFNYINVPFVTFSESVQGLTSDEIGTVLTECRATLEREKNKVLPLGYVVVKEVACVHHPKGEGDYVRGDFFFLK